MILCLVKISFFLFFFNLCLFVFVYVFVSSLFIYVHLCACFLRLYSLVNYVIPYVSPSDGTDLSA